MKASTSGRRRVAVTIAEALPRSESGTLRRAELAARRAERWSRCRTLRPRRDAGMRDSGGPWGRHDEFEEGTVALGIVTRGHRR
jgi:hypothetical protein